MSEPTTAAGRKMLGVLDSLMAVLHGIATADLPENIAAHAKTTDQVKEELAALVLAIEAEAAALVATPAPLDDSVRGEWGRQTCCPFPHDEDSGPDIHPRHQRTYQPATFAAATPAPLDVLYGFPKSYTEPEAAAWIAGVRATRTPMLTHGPKCEQSGAFTVHGPRCEQVVQVDATPAPLDVKRLDRALCSAIDAHFVTVGLVAAIAAAYAEEAES